MTTTRIAKAEANGAKPAERPSEQRAAISPPNIVEAEFRIVGTAPYVQNKFSAKARMQIHATQEAGTQSKSKRVREPKDFKANCEAATHRDLREGWCGIPAPAFRNALISACRLVGFKMTHAKLSVFVLADGLDEDGTPLVKIEGESEYSEMAVRNDSGVVDIRARPMWRQWSASVRVRFDGDQFSLIDVANLLNRAGMQVGIGEGRPDSKDSNGVGWGTFEVESDRE
jgi:hypothetical protein